jgi:hypothetical protein
LREVIKVAKRNNFNKLISKSNNKPKTLWGIVNKITGKCKNTCHPMQIVSDRVKHEDSQIIADVFGFYFDTIVYKKLKDTDIDPEFIRELKEIFKSLQNKKSSGYDGIPMRIMKTSMPFIISPFVYICNRALSMGIFTARPKYSQIHPIHEKEDEVDI